jgi:hypothetical protein
MILSVTRAGVYLWVLVVVFRVWLAMLATARSSRPGWALLLHCVQRAPFRGDRYAGVRQIKRSRPADL